MADLEPLRELYRWMREEHVSYARVGDLELRIEPAPIPQAKATDQDPPPVPGDALRDSLDELLHSSGIDAEPFVHVMRKAQS